MRVAYDIDNLPALLGEATLLAVQEHLETLRMDNPEDVGVADDGRTPIPNPNYIKIKAMKNRAASDLLAIMARVDSDALKGRRTDRTMEVIKRIKNWTNGHNIHSHGTN